MLEDRISQAPLPVEAWVVALVSLPAVGPARLRELLSVGTPEEVWNRLQRSAAVTDLALVRASGNRELFGRWVAAAAETDVAALWQQYVDAGIGVSMLGTPGYPPVLADDVEPPIILFHQGNPEVLGGPRVAIVGTRRATRYGLDVAYELGHDLAVAGVRVVSGLARGIDAAAHAGTLAASTPPVAVVGSGLDRIYPKSSSALWRAVQQRGVLFSEAPLGAVPERWRFPARNRIIAALADVVVVVETHETGGSLHTVNEAAQRDRPVLAVPGPVRSSSSIGCNQLLADGCAPCCGAEDVLCALGLTNVATGVLDTRPQPTGAAADVLTALGWQPVDIDLLVERSERPTAEVVAAVETLRADGWVSTSGRWIERVAAIRSQAGSPVS